MEKMKIRAIICMAVFIGSTLSITIPPGDTVKAYPSNGIWEYENQFFRYYAEVISETENTITLHETYFYQNEIFSEYNFTYDKITRKIVSPMKYEYYLWIWINKEDLSKPFIYAADKKLALIETTPDYYVFSYSDESGRGVLYYSRNSLTLVKTHDTIVINGERVSVSTILVDPNEKITFDEDNTISYIDHDTNDDDGYIAGSQSGSLENTDTGFYPPPYFAHGGYKYAKAEFSCAATANWNANCYLGLHYNYGEVNSGPNIGNWPLGRGITQSWAWVKGPYGGKFTCTASGNYRVEMAFQLYGSSQVSMVDAGFLGSGYASGKNILKCYLYDYETNYIAGSKIKTLFDASSTPTMFKVWKNEQITVTFNVYLYSGRSYYFKTELYDEFRAGHILLGAGYAKTSLQALLLHVEVSPL